MKWSCLGLFPYENLGIVLLWNGLRVLFMESLLCIIIRIVSIIMEEEDIVQMSELWRRRQNEKEVEDGWSAGQARQETAARDWSVRLPKMQEGLSRRSRQEEDLRPRRTISTSSYLFFWCSLTLNFNTSQLTNSAKPPPFEEVD